MTPRASSILERNSFPPSAVSSPLQAQVDSLVTHFVEEAANPYTLAALMAGGMAYRMGRLGVMSAWGGHVTAMPLRILSVGAGLGSEVTAFEFTNRVLQTVLAHGLKPVTGRAPLQANHSHLWSWSGSGGWQEGLLNSLITFGLLKGAGHLGREQNLIFQHAFQSTAMVAGHNTAGLLGISSRPEGSLAEQFLHAEATNLQLGASTSLLHSMSPGLLALERGFDLSLRSRESHFFPFLRDAGPFPFEGALQTSIGGSGRERMLMEGQELKPATPLVMMMGGNGKETPPEKPPSSPRTNPLLDLSSAEHQILTSQIEESLTRMIRLDSSQGAIRSLSAEDFRRMERNAPEDFQKFFESHFTPAEQERLNRFAETSQGRPPKFYSRIASLMATKKAVLALLQLDGPTHWQEIQFRFGRPDLFGEALRRLGDRGLLISASDDGDVGVGIALLEARPEASGLVGIGLDLTTDRVRYTTPENHALGEAAYKATFARHTVRQFNAKTGAEIQKQEGGTYLLTGKTAQAGRALRGEENSSEALEVFAAHFRVRDAVVGLVAVPSAKQIVLPQIVGGVSPRGVPTYWPKSITLNGVDVTHNLGRLNQSLSARARKPVDARQAISSLGPRLPGYGIGELILQERQNGQYVIGGNILFNGWREVGSFERILYTDPDAVNPALGAVGNGLQVHHESDQRKGLATQMTLGDLLFFREMGVKTFFVPVGRLGGGFWPERGFDFVDSATRDKKITQFRDFLFQQDHELTPQEELQLAMISDAWSLNRFKTEEGRTLGNDFLKAYVTQNWMTRFDLDPSYSGWKTLRESLKKIGFDHLLPSHLGVEALPSLLQWPRQVSFNDQALSNSQALDIAFSQIAGRDIDSRLWISQFASLPPQYRMKELQWKHTSPQNLEWSGRVADLNGEDAATFRRILHISPQGFHPPFAVGKGVDVSPRHQGNGIGTRITLNDLLFLRALGVPNYEVPIGRQGGRFWPILGFDFAHYSVRDEVLRSFQAFLMQNKIVLSKNKQQELDQIVHSWELTRFTLEDGRNVGKKFLETSSSWDSHFILSPTYIGWGVFRRALEKIGSAHLLPSEFGQTSENE